MHCKTKHMNPIVLAKMARFWHDTDNEQLREGLNVQLFMVWAVHSIQLAKKNKIKKKKARLAR